MNSAGPPIYNLLTLVAVIITGWFWARWFRRDSRLFVVYLGALGGALLGAKLLYLLVDGWRAWGAEDRWLQWATGKTVLGALLGVTSGWRSRSGGSVTGPSRGIGLPWWHRWGFSSAESAVGFMVVASDALGIPPGTRLRIGPVWNVGRPRRWKSFSTP